MGVVFLLPWVWLLAAAVAVPVAIHLLERERSRQLAFPSLRFIVPARLSAVRRRRLQDVPLLAIRAGVVLAAVMALSGPIFVTAARQEAWARRVARAVVLDDRSASPDDELRSAAAGASFVRDRLGDAIRDAVRWLDEQHPVAREIVILSSFRRSALTPADLAVVPEGVGVRLARTSAGTPVRERETVRLALRGEAAGGSTAAGPVGGGPGGRGQRRPSDQLGTGQRGHDPALELGREDWLDFEPMAETKADGERTAATLPGLVRITERLTLTPGASRLAEVRVEPVRVVPITVSAPAGEQARADAALRAVLRRGVRLPPAGLMQPLAVEWPGGVEALAAQIDARLRASLDAWEPEAMSDAELEALARPTRPAADPRPEDAGDRRLVWGAVLALLAAETWIRRGAA